MVHRPIIFGSIATSLNNKKADDQHTHKWKVFVRGANNEDISYYVKKVVFKLHESFANPNRSLLLILMLKSPTWTHMLLLSAVFLCGNYCNVQMRMLRRLRQRRQAGESLKS